MVRGTGAQRLERFAEIVTRQTTFPLFVVHGIAKREMPQGQIKKTTGDESTSSDDEYFIQEVEHVFQAIKIRETRSLFQDSVCKVRRHTVHVDIHIDPDSGADVNVMDEYMYQLKALIHRTAHKPTLQPSKDQVKHLATLPSSERGIQYNHSQLDLWDTSKFNVEGGRITSPPLLSLTTVTELGMIAVQPDGSFTQLNGMRMREGTIYCQTS